jgi:hypothetical protein
MLGRYASHSLEPRRTAGAYAHWSGRCTERAEHALASAFARRLVWPVCVRAEFRSETVDDRPSGLRKCTWPEPKGNLFG